VQALEEHGVWWLPGGPEAFGTLRFDTERGVRLEVAPSLQLTSGTSVAPLILGRLATGQHVTLLDSRFFGPPYRLTQEEWFDLRPRTALIGIHAHEGVEHLVRGVEVEYSGLIEWLSPQWLELDLGPERKGISTQLPPEESHDITCGTLDLWHALGPGETSARERSLRLKAGLRLTTKQPRPLSFFQTEFVRPLQDLLTLLTAGPVAVLSLVAQLEDEVGTRRGVDVLYAPLVRPELAPIDIEPLARRSDYPGTIGDLVDGWLKLREDIRPVQTLISALEYKDGVFLDQKFLYAVHAAEAYHRLTDATCPWDKKAWKGIKAEIKDAFPDYYANWLGEHLSFANSWTFEQRIASLYGNAATSVKDAIGAEDRFLQLTKDTRNYHTHYPPALRAKAAKSSALLWLTQSLLLLVEDALLRDLGLDEGARNALFTASRRMGRVRFHRPEGHDA